MSELNQGATLKSVSSNLITATTEHAVAINEIIWLILDEVDKKRSTPRRVKAEIVRIRGQEFDAKVYGDTTNLKAGLAITLTREMLSIDVGPGLLGGVYDGLGNPLAALVDVDGSFIKSGSTVDTIDQFTSYLFTPIAKIGDIVEPGYTVGIVKESVFDHRIMMPLTAHGCYRVVDIVSERMLTHRDIVATVEQVDTRTTMEIKLSQRVPVRRPLTTTNAERLLPSTPLSTSVRMIDALFPIAVGGTACIPGSSRSGKTTLQQTIALSCDADVIIFVACGQRSTEFAQFTNTLAEHRDKQTGRSLMERSIIIASTPSMAGAIHESAVLNAVTFGEYYRLMGLRVVVLIDSLSRFADAVRETSSDLREIQWDDAYPAYLSTQVAQVFARAGVITLDDKQGRSVRGALTIIGTIALMANNSDDHVTKSALPVVGCFLKLSRHDAENFPAIDLGHGWSRYADSIASALDARYFSGFASTVMQLRNFAEQGTAINNRMRVMGEDFTSIADYVHLLKTNFLTKTFLEQDNVDDKSSYARTSFLLQEIMRVITHPCGFDHHDKDSAGKLFERLTILFCERNLVAESNPHYHELSQAITALLGTIPA